MTNDIHTHTLAHSINHRESRGRDIIINVVVFGAPEFVLIASKKDRNGWALNTRDKRRRRGRWFHIFVCLVFSQLCVYVCVCALYFLCVCYRENSMFDTRPIWFDTFIFSHIYLWICELSWLLYPLGYIALWHNISDSSHFFFLNARKCVSSYHSTHFTERTQSN